MSRAHRSAASGVDDGCADARAGFWRDVYERHFDDVYRTVSRFGVRAPEAEDLTQRVFLRAYERLSGSLHVENLGGWLCGITVRVVAEHRRWQRVRRLKEWLLRVSWHERHDEPPTPEELSETRETRRRVGAVIDRMTPKLREVLVLRDIEGRELPEVAAILEVPVNTVRSRTRLAREQFQRLWTAARFDGGGDR